MNQSILPKRLTKSIRNKKKHTAVTAVEYYSKAEKIFILRAFFYIIRRFKKQTKIITLFTNFLPIFSIYLTNHLKPYIFILYHKNSIIFLTTIKRLGVISDYLTFSVRRVLRIIPQHFSSKILKKAIRRMLTIFIKLYQNRVTDDKFQLLCVFFSITAAGANRKLSLKLYPKRAFLITLTVKKLVRLMRIQSINTLVFLNTPRGLMSHIEAFRLRVGGGLFCKIA